MVFDAVSSDIDEFLSINPSSNVFVFADSNVYHKKWPTYSDRTDRPGELYNFYYLKWHYSLLTSLPVSLTVTITVLLFSIFFFWCYYLNWVLLQLLLNFVSGVRLELIYIYIYIYHCKYQVKPHSSPWCSTFFSCMAFLFALTE